jgi:hypothetical protein
MPSNEIDNSSSIGWITDGKVKNRKLIYRQPDIFLAARYTQQLLITLNF